MSFVRQWKMGRVPFICIEVPCRHSSHLSTQTC